MITTLDVDNYSPLPAITICYPYFLSMERVIQKYPHLKPKFNDYKQTLNNMNESQYDNEDINNYLNDIYSNEFNKFIYEQNLTVRQLSELGIPNPIETGALDIYINGMKLYPDKTVKFVKLTMAK